MPPVIDLIYAGSFIPCVIVTLLPLRCGVGELLSLFMLIRASLRSAVH